MRKKRVLIVVPFHLIRLPLISNSVVLCLRNVHVGYGDSPEDGGSGCHLQLKAFYVKIDLKMKSMQTLSFVITGCCLVKKKFLLHALHISQLEQLHHHVHPR
ncbi:hypothetical protein BU24DRAFT_420061 [Aaosphaeria arxii CBS 175.79]|uniref:Secreted protein n=1 Tax=Aaosphaeria arxii CBS 175.79 TaxID=1450172 RepID=A0A6A5XUK0_9PLEO|nr:uncharacterized protein BU24DRAFT_420061 [Aaosphaeria arxii CBS 175.79]KAF2017035.1 hypothetical protein BU24DRAFT_420061 [Aaosphaeria arxii CBS 175.79]